MQVKSFIEKRDVSKILLTTENFEQIEIDVKYILDDISLSFKDGECDCFSVLLSPNLPRNIINRLNEYKDIVYVDIFDKKEDRIEVAVPWSSDSEFGINLSNRCQYLLEFENKDLFLFIKEEEEIE